MPQETLIRNTKELKKQRNLNTSDVSEATKIPCDTIKAWLSTRKVLPQTDHLIKLSQLFGVSIDALCRGSFENLEWI